MIRFSNVGAQPEQKFTTHDGPIWPVCRSMMRNEQQIIARMAEDFSACADAADCVTVDDFVRIGWTAKQIVDHCAEARQAFLCGKKSPEISARPLAQEAAHMAASALASLAIVASIACLCWALPGGLA